MRKNTLNILLAFTILASLSSSCTSMTRSESAEIPKVAATPYYLPSDIMGSFQSGPPASLGSPIDKKDMKALKSAQLNRSKSDCDRAAAGALPVNPAYQEFFGEIGPFTTPLQGEEREFIIRVWSDSSFVAEFFKKKYKWPRPYDVDATIVPCLKKTTSPAFPSGHATVSRVFALILSDLIPNNRSVYLKRADEIAEDRFLAGMHRSSELEAGKALADQIYARFLESDLFQQDFARIRALIRH